MRLPAANDRFLSPNMDTESERESDSDGKTSHAHAREILMAILLLHSQLLIKPSKWYLPKRDASDNLLASDVMVLVTSEKWRHPRRMVDDLIFPPAAASLAFLLPARTLPMFPPVHNPVCFLCLLSCVFHITPSDPEVRRQLPRCGRFLWIVMRPGVALVCFASVLPQTQRNSQRDTGGAPGGFLMFRRIASHCCA